MWETFGGLGDPRPESAHRRCGAALEDDVGGLHKQGAQVLVTPLGNSSELGATAGRVLLRDEAEPCGEVASLLEPRTGTDGRHHGAGDDGTDTGNRHQALAGPIVLGEVFNLG